MHQRFVVKRLQSQEEAQAVFCCMSEVPIPWPEAVKLCRVWASQNLGKHLEGYHLQDADGTAVGQLYYAPSERALVPYEVEPGVAVVYCEWIQRHYQKQGLGRMLYSAFEAEMQQQGLKGILVEGTNREEQMHYRHYLARGFRVLHEAADRTLLYRPLHQSEIQFRPLKNRIQPRQGVPVEILILNGYLCPFETSSQVLLLEVAQEFGDRVVVRQEPLTAETLRRYGVVDGIFINGRQKLTGGATEQAIRQAILEEL